MAKEFERDLENIEDIPDAADTAADTEKELREAIEEALSEDGRSVKKIDHVAEDPLAESESSEDIYSGNYKRDTSDRGVYTGGTKNERMMSDTLGTEESRSARRRKRQQKRRNRRILITLLVLALLAGLGYGAFAKRDTLKALLPGAKEVVTTEEPTTEEETEEETTVPETTVPPTTEAPKIEIQTTMPKDTVPEVKTLVDNYYNALTEGNAKQMVSILDPAVTVDEDTLQAQINNQNQMVEYYDDVTTYVMDGANPGEYATYISYAMKFEGVDTPAPGLVPAYVRPDETGALRLLRYEDFDDTVKAFMSEVSQKDEVKDLAAKVNEAYAAAQASDPALKAFIDNLAAAQAATEASSEAESATTTAGDISFTTTDDIRYAKSQVKCRKTPVIDDSEDYVLVDKGAWVHVVGDSEEWCHVYMQDGTEGYVYREYLTILPPEQWTDD